MVSAVHLREREAPNPRQQTFPARNPGSAESRAGAREDQVGAVEGGQVSRAPGRILRSCIFRTHGLILTDTQRGATLFPMPHTRPRHLESRIRQALTWSPSVSLVGMRQSGKTTLVKRMCPGYLSFDDDALVGATEAGNWDQFLGQPRPLALDEVQKAPRVFSRFKLWIDERRRPGQFVLTGSVRFLSRRAIRESLTGRTALLELLPLTVAEAHGRPLANAVSRLLKLDDSTLRRL
jgi:hypothetical protein